jgi:hypothetical protein
MVRGQDHRPPREALDVNAPRDLIELTRVQPVKELVAAQKLDDVLRRRAQRSIQ